MIQLLFTLLLAEVLAVAALLVRIPLRRPILLGLDLLKRGPGPLVVRTVAATGLVLLGCSLNSMAKIQARSAAEEGGFLTPTDQVLLSRRLLEASLIGYSLLLCLIIDWLHHDGRELHGLRKIAEGVMKQNRVYEDADRELQQLRKNMESVMKQNRVLEEAKRKHSHEINAQQGKIESLTEQIEQMRLLQNRVLEEAKSKHSHEINAQEGKIKSLTEQIEQMKLKQSKMAEANAVALRKQSEGLLFEYDRLLKENLGLQEQLQTMDRHSSHSDRKKNL